MSADFQRFAGASMNRQSITRSLFAVLAFAPLALSLTASAAVAAKGDCGQPLSTGSRPSASDALFVLRAGVGAQQGCTPSVCDVDNSGRTTAGDALRILKFAVGDPTVVLNCPAATTTTTTTSTTTSTTTTTTLCEVMRMYPNACAEITLNSTISGAVDVRQPGPVQLIIDLCNLDDVNTNGLDDAPVEIIDFEFDIEDDTFGMFSIGLNEVLFDPHPVIAQPSIGMIEETTNNTPGKLDVPPYAASGTATIDFDLFVAAEIDIDFDGTPIMAMVHHDVPMTLNGVISNDPPLPGEALDMLQAPGEVIILNPFDVPFFGATIDSVSVDLTAETCEPIEVPMR